MRGRNGKTNSLPEKNIIFVFFEQRNGECASCALYIEIVTDDEIQTEFSRMAAREGKVQFQVVPNSYLHTSFELLGLVKNSKKFQPDQLH